MIVVKGGEEPSIFFKTGFKYNTQILSVFYLHKVLDSPEKLDFKYEIKGTADIIVNDRRLIERLFDNLKYRIQ